MDSNVSISLTSIEKKQLKTALLGYGKLEYASRKTGLHVNTLRMVNLRGTGTTETITTIRQILLKPDAKLTPVNTTEN